jgi:putative ATP-binding cassette transporter
MVWAAVMYAAAGSLLSYWVGGTLINRNAERYAREADLRFPWCASMNTSTAYRSRRRSRREPARRAASGGGAGRYAPAGHWPHQSHLGHRGLRLGHAGGPDPGRSAAVLRRQAVVWRPDDGGAAFTQAQSALRWFVDNFSVIADWRATLLRVASFRRALVTTDVVPHIESRITYAEGEPGRIVIENLEVASSSGCDMLRESRSSSTPASASSSSANPAPTRRNCFAR